MPLSPIVTSPLKALSLQYSLEGVNKLFFFFQKKKKGKENSNTLKQPFWGGENPDLQEFLLISLLSPLFPPRSEWAMHSSMVWQFLPFFFSLHHPQNFQSAWTAYLGEVIFHLSLGLSHAEKRPRECLLLWPWIVL